MLLSPHSTGPSLVPMVPAQSPWLLLEFGAPGSILTPFPGVENVPTFAKEEAAVVTVIIRPFPWENILRKILLIWTGADGCQWECNSWDPRSGQSGLFFRPHKKALTKGISALAHRKTGTKLLSKHLGTVIPSDRMENSREVAVRAGAGLKCTEQRMKNIGITHCLSTTCQAGLRAGTNKELAPHGPKVDKRPQTSEF